MCRAWEAAAQEAQTRVVMLRTGIVLAKEASALLVCLWVGGYLCVRGCYAQALRSLLRRAGCLLGWSAAGWRMSWLVSVGEGGVVGGC